MKQSAKNFLLQRGKHLLQLLLVAVMTGSLIFSSCAGCSSSDDNGGGTQQSETATACENLLSSTSANATVSADDFQNIISTCYENEANSDVAAVIEKYPVVYNYTVLIYDLQKFLETAQKKFEAIKDFLPSFSPSYAPPEDTTGMILYNLFMKDLLPYMDDINKRVGILVKQDMDSVSVYYESVPFSFDLSTFMKDTENTTNIPSQIDLKGEWDYPEVLLIGAVNNGLFALWKLIESQTLGSPTDISNVYNEYSFTASLDDPTQITNLIASFLGEIPALLAFEPTEGKEIFKDQVRNYVDATLSYLTGRDNDLEVNGTMYAAANPGLFAAIENMYSKDQSKSIIQFVDKDGNGEISYKDQIVIPIVEEIESGAGTITNPLSRQTWLDLVAFGKEIENQLENYESATASLDMGKIINEVFGDLVTYANEISPDANVSVPTIPEGFLMLNAGALFKAVETEDSFGGLRNLLPAWVPNPRVDSDLVSYARKDTDNAKTPFKYIMVFETEVSAATNSTEYMGLGPFEYNNVLYYGIYSFTKDPAHFNLFFNADGSFNALFFGNTDPSADSGSAYLGNLHSIDPDGLLPNAEHDFLVYLGFQQPTFYGMVQVDPSKFADISGCDTEELVNSTDAQQIVNGVINCAILEFGTPVSDLLNAMSYSPVDVTP